MKKISTITYADGNGPLDLDTKSIDLTTQVINLPEDNEIVRTTYPPLKDQNEMTWEELIELRARLNEQIEELLAHQKVLSDEFLFRLQEEKISGKIVNNYTISKAVRYGFETTLEEAKELGATKTVVDQSALKKLYLSGKVTISGVNKTEYVIVREVIKEKDNV